MKFTTFHLITAAFLATQATAFPLQARDASDADIARLAPELGITPGIPFGDGSADCLGANGKRIPCQCPPSRDDFVKALQANVHAGHCVNNTVVQVNFPTDDSVESQLARIDASAVTLQNFEAAGKGCPFVATTFGAQQAAIKGSPATPTSSTVAPSATASSNAPPTSTDSSAPVDTNSPDGQPSDALIKQLAPSLGFRKGVNPTGSGDCDGAAKGADGKPIKVPCFCPPDRDEFVAKLIANVQAGHVVTNPTVKISFPTDDSDEAKLTRINAASSTLQNLNGAGNGCPIAATTLKAQDAAIRAGTPPPADQSDAPASDPPANNDGGDNAPSGGGSSSTSGSGDFPADPTKLTDAQIDQLTPDLGFIAGQNPTGNGDCDGAAKDASGNPIKVPCSCPPARPDFLQHVIANVRANKVVNNTDVPWVFPTGNSIEDQLGRNFAATVSLQNLFAAGKGCPNAATTLGKQQAELQKKLNA